MATTESGPQHRLSQLLVSIGVVGKPHGYKGACVVRTSEGKNSALGYIEGAYIGATASQAKYYRILERAWMPKGWKIHLEGFTGDHQIKPIKQA